MTEGSTPLAILMISLNEAHNMEAVLENVSGFAREVFLVDSFSSDETVDIALRHGVHVVQRRFRGFGDQWNFATNELPITAPWTMKLDPDERLTDELKASIRREIAKNDADAIIVRRRLWFMGQPMPVRQDILRLWRTGTCRFSDVLVNEHPIVPGRVTYARGDLEHHDSPNLQHWLDKQNAYTTAEALASWREDALSEQPTLFGSALSRRMWLKRNFSRVPFRFIAMEYYCLLVQGSWRAGTVGFIWAKLRADVYRFRAYKLKEMQLTDRSYVVPPGRTGAPHPRAIQALVKEDSAKTKRRATSSGSQPGIAYHDLLAAGWEGRYSRGGFKRRARFFSEEIWPRLRLQGSWIDVGCGSGYFSRLLARSGVSVLGVDGSAAMITEARAIAAEAEDPQPRYEVGTVEELGVPDGSYDGAICLSVLEYLDDPDDCMQRILRSVRPGGQLVISVPNSASLLRRLQTGMRALLSRRRRVTFDYLATSVQSWSPAELGSMAQRYGLECEAIVGFDPLFSSALWRFLPPSLLFLVARRPEVDAPQA